MGLDCRKCNEYLKKERGCTEDSFIPGKWIDPFNPEESFQRCPRTVVTPESYEYLDAYFFFKEAHKFPHAGGCGDQPAKYIQTIKIIASEIQRIRQEGAKQ